MNTFHWPRFTRVLCNDFLQQWKKIWIATLAVIGIGSIIYLTNLDSGSNNETEMAVVLFVIALLAGGLLFTSTIFADLHDPLQRFHYLTLPSSTFERFLSRYLLSAPLYYLYVLGVYALFDPLIGAIGRIFMGQSAATFAPFSQPAWQLTLVYFGMHAVMFGGAIYFRSYAMMKTGWAVALISLGITLVQVVAVLVFYWDSIRSLMPLEIDHGIILPLAIGNPLMWSIVGVAFYVWLLYIAYQCLCDHEVQDEL